MQINVGSVIFAIVSIAIAKVVTVWALPFFNEALGITPKQQEWLFLLTIWAFGYWGYALKVYLKENISNQNMKKTPHIDAELTQSPQHDANN